MLLCTGKIYYELDAERERLRRTDVAIIRVEQLYPFPTDDLAALLARYPSARSIRWVQEEPSNMGAWNCVLEKLRERLPAAYPLTCVARPRSGSPATGSQAGAMRVTRKRSAGRALTK